MPKTILICSDNEKFRDALKGLLANYFPLIIVESLNSCLETIRKSTNIQLIYIELETIVDEAETALSQIKAAAPSMTIITVGRQHEDDAAAGTVRYGATGYILEPLRAEEVLALARKNCS
ncbi:MAG: hypothetical protein HQL19_05705 [Candidatus Omnitrophica bacterium]|nr:hypothetical protein [Candidatus Omnitrophota bacterium]